MATVLNAYCNEESEKYQLENKAKNGSFSGKKSCHFLCAVILLFGMICAESNISFVLCSAINVTLLV